MMKKLIAILILAFVLRMYGINWDGSFHLHPDERMLIMVADRIHFFDQLNPHFYNYGTLPIYLLKGASQIIGMDNYNAMLYVGRFLSIFFDFLTIFLIYKIANLLFKNEKIALFSSLFYAIAFFPIQNSHFFISDVFLTFFLTLLILILLKSLSLPSWTDRIKMVVLIGAIFGATLATKFTAIIFLPIILLFIFFKKGILSTIYYLSSTIVLFIVFMPYAFLDYKKFLTDVMLQIKMNNNPYIFPYTLQYVGTIPYLYYLKNIFWWGLGPIISFLSIIGLLSLRSAKWRRSNLFLFFLFYFFYFLIIGRSAVKFMRYMLPMYPFFAILSGVGLFKITQLGAKMPILNDLGGAHPEYSGEHAHGVKNAVSSPIIYFILFIHIFWTVAFLNIYSQPHTRLTATEWILKNIPAGSTLAVEHWDDRLPLYRGERYKFVEMTLYDQPDDGKKWQILNEKLKLADYLIIASNRLYVPLQKLTDCKKYKVCFPKTAEYYKNLLVGKPVIAISFKKIAEFSVYPQFQISNFKFQINDSSADESFTVYDHPKIMIFKKTSLSIPVSPASSQRYE